MINRRQALVAGMTALGTSALPVEAKPVAENLVVNNGMNIFIVTEDEGLLRWGGHGECCVVDKKHYLLVKEYVDAHKGYLDSLMVWHKPGTVVYWEENHHDRIAVLLVKKHDVPRRHISNALSALGY